MPLNCTYNPCHQVQVSISLLLLPDIAQSTHFPEEVNAEQCFLPLWFCAMLSILLKTGLGKNSLS